MTPTCRTGRPTSNRSPRRRTCTAFRGLRIRLPEGLGPDLRHGEEGEQAHAEAHGDDDPLPGVEARLHEADFGETEFAALDDSAEILAAVRDGGDARLIELTERLDGGRIEQIAVPAVARARALERIPAELSAALREAVTLRLAELAQKHYRRGVKHFINENLQAAVGSGLRRGVFTLLNGLHDGEVIRPFR